MQLATAEKFYKSGVCPPSETWLRLNLKTESYLNDLSEVSEHLENCEFCSAELHFLNSFPLAETVSDNQPSEIPPALKQLAESLLGNRQTEFRLLDILLSGNEQLTLKNA